MSKPYKRSNSPFWWIRPIINGVQVRQSSGTVDYAEALRQLKILEGKLAAGVPITANTDRNSFTFLLDKVERDYAKKELVSEEDMKRRIKKHISPKLGFMQTANITTDVIDDFIIARKKEKAANASINRELAIIHRAFVLGMRSGAVSAIPYFEKQPESDNVRTGYFNEAAFRKVLAQANPLLRDILIVAYYTGWRKESIVQMEWRNVDLVRNLASLSAAQTKNDKATAFPMEPFPELREVFERRCKETKELERKDSKIISRVFHRNGEPVKNIRTAWEKARKRAGQPEKLLHDMRRTAVRNLGAVGFNRTEIKNIVGLKTDSMFTRYNISNEQDILETAARIAAEKAAAKHA